MFLLILLSAIFPFLGAINFSIKQILSQPISENFIFWQLRVPRVLLAFMTGSVLSLVGLIFQYLFRNPLATPYTLGVSSAASAGVVLSMKLGLSLSFFGLSSSFIFGFLGSVISLLIILIIAQSLRNYSIYTLLMCGVAMNFFFSSLVVIVQYLFDIHQSFSAIRWLMGGISLPGYKTLVFLFPFYIVFLILVLFFSKELAILSVSDDFALSKGVEIKKIRNLMLLFISLIIGIFVSICGPIAFVGLVIPHITRIFFQEIKRTILFSSVFGSFVLVFTDYIARTLLAPVEIPVGVITSLIGAPFFLFILIAKKTN